MTLAFGSHGWSPPPFCSECGFRHVHWTCSWTCGFGILFYPFCIHQNVQRTNGLNHTNSCFALPFPCIPWNSWSLLTKVQPWEHDSLPQSVNFCGSVTCPDPVLCNQRQCVHPLDTLVYHLNCYKINITCWNLPRMLDSRNQIHISESYFVWSCMQSVNYNHFPLSLWLLGAQGGWMEMRHAPFHTRPQERHGRRHLGGTWRPSEALQVLREKACLWWERTWQRGWWIEGPESQLQFNKKTRKKVALFLLTSAMISSSLSESSHFIPGDW